MRLGFPDFLGGSERRNVIPSTSPIPTIQPFSSWPNVTDNSTVVYQFPVAALSLFDVGFLILFIPFMDWLQRHLDKRGQLDISPLVGLTTQMYKTWK